MKFRRLSASTLLLAIASFAIWNTPHSVSAIGAVIFSDDFSSFETGGGTTNAGAQASTSLTLGAFRDLAGWTKSGSNGVHGVDRDITSGVNWAPSFWYDNEIEMTTGVAANTNGSKYTVSFDLGPSVYANPGQATRQSDGMVVSVVRANGTTLTTSTHMAGVWDWSTNAQAMTRRSFTYTGDGSGSVKLRFAATVPGGADRFGGAIDNVELRSGDDCDPTSTTVSGATVLSFTTIGTCMWTVPSNVSSVRSLVVAGGGGGGGGGGGAGGFVATASTSVTPGDTIAVTVGRGGLGATKTGSGILAGTDGLNSVFGSITADGGGGGGAVQSAGRTGGSSGGAGQDSTNAATSSSQGFSGAAGRSTNGGTGASGGGGAGSVGIWGHLMSEFPDQRTMGGNGGAGTTSNITGTTIGYAGGGGGGANNNASPTADRGFGGSADNNIYGAGDGSYSNTGSGSSAQPNTGSGGGGGDWEGGGGNGGSGIVVLRFTAVAPTTTTPTTTTTVRAATTTVAPALDIVVNAPTTTSAPVGQSAIAKVSSTSSTSSTLPAATTGTTTTVPTKAGGTVPPPAPKIGAVAPGEAAVTVGEKTQPVTVKRADNQVTVTAGELSATLGSLNAKGAVAALDADGNVRLKPGDTVRIKLAGFKPGSIVEAWLFSTPQLLGTAKVGADGIVVGTFTIPKNISQGSHRIAVVAQTVDGKPATLAVGIKVGEWKKEKSIAIWLIILPIVAAVFGALFLPAVIRRRRHNEV